MIPKLFSELGLSEELLKAVGKLGFEQASPIQATAIPVLMEGRDVVGQSQTGSGKTAAFAIPAIERVNPQDRTTQVLILCPTRELAVQVSEEVHKLALFKKGIFALPIYGGQSYDRQLYGLKQGAQIVIGTPGRVMDHMKRGTLQLKTVKTVILDEADVMLDMGFRDDIEFILKSVPAERQTVFFSATMPRPIQELIKKYARNPAQLSIEQQAATVPTVEQSYYEVDRRFKVELLTRLIDIHDFKIGIVFCNTKRMVDDLVDHLNAQGYSADRLHGDMNQTMRDRVMNKFRKSGLEFLVATDVAARGIDVDDVQVVFNYDLPYDGEDYVHRIGRTGRAGRPGIAISFAAGREVFQIAQIERYTKRKIDRARIPTANEVEQARTDVFLIKLRTLLAGGDYKKHDHTIEILLEEGFQSTDIASALINLLQQTDTTATAPSENFDRPERGDRPDSRGGFRDRAPQPPMIRKPASPLPPPVPRPRAVAQPVRPAFVPTPTPSVPAPQVVPASAVETPVSAVEKQVSDLRIERTPRVVETSQPAVAPSPVPPKKVILKKAIPRSSPASASPMAAPTSPVIPPAPFREKRIVRAPRQERGVFTAKEPFKTKASRRTPDTHTRIFMNVGQEMGVEAADVTRGIMGETGLPASAVGTVDLRERHLFVDVSAEHANAIISKMNRSSIKGHAIKVKIA